MTSPWELPMPWPVITALAIGGLIGVLIPAVIYLLGGYD